MPNVVLFDGECHFCDQSVQFIIKRDPNAIFTFASLQSETGKQLRSTYNIPETIDSMILIADKSAYTKSSAALRIAGKLKGLWKLCYALILVPRPLRDFFYDKIAANRYKWFGKKESCELPSPAIRARFIE